MEKDERLAEKQKQPIAVFDSGVGGISVLKEMVKVMPNEDFIYYGDSKHAPYGTKSLEEVRRLTIMHTQELLEQGAKAVAIACNTATSAAVRILRQMYPELPLVGIEPALKPAVLFKRHPRVLVMATPMTIREEKFHLLLERYQDQAEIYPLPCPGLMEYVESGHADSLEVRVFLEKLLGEYRQKRMDAVVLGCTHYPFVKDVIADVMGPGVHIFDGGEGTARELRRRVHAAGLANPDIDREGKILFESSDFSQEKLRLFQRLFKN